MRACNKIQAFSGNLRENKSLSNFCNDNNITWNFIPAISPHLGGIWESAVRLAKYHASQIIGNCHFTFEELSIVFAQIEAVLNSRSLTELSFSPNDLSPLTPGHFLIGSPLTSLPEPDVQGIPTSLLSKYEVLRKCMQYF